MQNITMACKNCMDYDEKTKSCTIRNLILKDKTKIPLPRKPDQTGCKVFFRKSQGVQCKI